MILYFFISRKEELEEKDRLQAQIQLDKNETHQREKENLELRVSLGIIPLNYGRIHQRVEKI